MPLTEAARAERQGNLAILKRYQSFGTASRQTSGQNTQLAVLNVEKQFVALDQFTLERFS